MLETPYFQDLPKEKRKAQLFMAFNGTGLRGRPAVYIIENAKTHKSYVGSSRNLAARILSHKRQLFLKEHINYRLQFSFTSTVSKDNWIVHIGLFDTVEEALAREQMILDEGFGHPDLVNLAPSAYRGGTPESHQRSIEKLRKFTQTKEFKEATGERSREKWKGLEYREKVLSKTGHSVIIDGVKYLSVREASKATCFCIATIRSRLKDGVADLSDVQPPLKRVKCQGKEFNSVTEAALFYNIKGNTMVYRLKSKADSWKDFIYM